MPTFTLTGAEDPFLHIALRNGESIACESDAMVMMEDTLGLTGRVQGGIMQAVMRKFANGESFFQQQIKATRGDGDCLLGAQLPGAMEVLDVGRIQYRINDGAYVASTEGVAVTARMQGVGNALFGASGGFFVGETSGQGQVVVAGFGSVFSLDVDPRKDMLIDNGHVVAWDAKLHYEVSA